MDSLVIIGASGHAKVVVDIVEKQGRYRIAGLLDQNLAADAEVFGHRILGREEDFLSIRDRFVVRACLVAVGDNFVRSRVVSRLRALCPDLVFASAVHPHAVVARGVTIGEGTVIMAGAVINPCCVIGRGCIINTRASLDHDSVMDDFASLAPAVATGGNVRIGAFTAVGIGATISHGIQVGAHTVIGAGATVLHDVPAFKVAYGTPAGVIRERREGDTYL